jgi:hypothetical protein
MVSSIVQVRNKQQQGAKGECTLHVSRLPCPFTSPSCAQSYGSLIEWLTRMSQALFRSVTLARLKRHLSLLARTRPRRYESSAQKRQMPPSHFAALVSSSYCNLESVGRSSVRHAAEKRRTTEAVNSRSLSPGPGSPPPSAQNPPRRSTGLSCADDSAACRCPR